MLLGLDIGTTAVKALLTDDEVQPLAEGSAEYGLRQPRPGWSEQDAEDWWRALISATRQALQKAGRDDVRALAVSTQGDTLVPVDGCGRPLAPARTWMDTRTGDLIGPLEAAIAPAEWYATTGSRLGPFCAALTIVWLRERLPEVFRSAARFSLVADFIIQRLTGSALLDHPNASRTLLFDIHARQWSSRLLEAVEVGEERLSPVHPSGTIAGTLRAAAAEELGLPSGVPVVLGGHDQTCAAVGAGVVRPGTLLLSCGTAWVLLAAPDRPLLDQDLRRVQTYCHAAPDRWALLTAHAGGNLLSWLRETLYAGRSVSYEDITAEAAGASGAHPPPLLLPHFYGAPAPEWMRRARGVLLGLTLSHNRADIALAVLQGVALEVARNLASMREMGAETSEVRMIGGGARSDLWAQMIADATGATVVRPQVGEAAAYGAALLAGVGVGLLPPIDELVAEITVRDVLSARPDAREHYQDLLLRFTEACESLRGLW